MRKSAQGLSLVLMAISAACDGPGTEQPPTAKAAASIEAASEPEKVTETGWTVHEKKDAMTDVISRSATVAGLQEDGAPAKLTFMCEPETPDFEVILIDTTAYLGGDGSNVGYRIDGGEPAYVSARGQRSLHGVSIVNKPELVAALQNGGKEIVIQLVAYQVVMTFPLKNAKRAIEEVIAACKPA